MDRHEISRILGMPLHEQKHAIEAKVAECIEQLDNEPKLCLTKHLEVPHVDYDLTGTTAGQAWGGHRIRVNTSLLHTDWDEMLNVTVPHEVAHCVVHQIWGSRGINYRSHGQQWAFIMSLLGLPATRCHYMQVTKTRKHPRKYQYDCGCQIHNFTLTLHNKIQHKHKTYHCTDCGGPIDKDTYLGERGDDDSISSSR